MAGHLQQGHPLPGAQHMPHRQRPRGGPTPPGQGGCEDTRHPKIKLLMDPYLKRYNNYVNIPEILTASGKRMSDLPTLPKYCHPMGQ